MSRPIGFRRPTQSLGRNGVMKMTGIHVSRQGDALFVAPITSKMPVGRAWMLVPLDAVADVAKAMLDLSDNARNRDAEKRAA
jgi:hypothetical protein